MSDLPEHQTAIALDEFGGLDHLTLQQIPVREPREDEILIRVHTAGVGVWDPSEREGKMAERMDEEPDFPYVLGSDGSGTVVEVGADVDGFDEGDTVWASHFLNPRGGFYSEYVPVKAEFAAPVPEGLSMNEAGAMPAEPPYSTISLIGSAYWFAYFLVILPLLGVIEKPGAEPATIEEDFDSHYGKASGTAAE